MDVVQDSAAAFCRTLAVIYGTKKWPNQFISRPFGRLNATKKNFELFSIVYENPYFYSGWLELAWSRIMHRITLKIVVVDGYSWRVTGILKSSGPSKVGLKLYLKLQHF